MWNELLSSVQFFLDRYSYLPKNNQAHALAGKSQHLEAAWITSTFLSPEEEQELLRQLCSSESCTIPLNKKARNFNSLSTSSHHLLQQYAVLSLDPTNAWMHLNIWFILFAVNRPKCCSSTAWQNPESKGEFASQHTYSLKESTRVNWKYPSNHNCILWINFTFSFSSTKQMVLSTLTGINLLPKTWHYTQTWISSLHCSLCDSVRSA